MYNDENNTQVELTVKIMKLNFAFKIITSHGQITEADNTSVL